MRCIRPARGAAGPPAGPGPDIRSATGAGGTLRPPLRAAETDCGAGATHIPAGGGGGGLARAAVRVAVCLLAAPARGLGGSGLGGGGLQVPVPAALLPSLQGACVRAKERKRARERERWREGEMREIRGGGMEGEK